MDAILTLVRSVLSAETEPAAPALGVWIELVESWARKIDITAARDRRELVDLMIADACVLARAIAPRARVIDVGSGAGAPGLALAIMRTDLEVTLAEPMQKRAALLRLALARALPLLASPPRVAIVQERGERVQASGGRFDVAISRATLPPPAWLALGAELAPAGDVWVLLAREADPTLAGWRAVEAIDYAWPLTGAARRAVRYRHALR